MTRKIRSTIPLLCLVAAIFSAGLLPAAAYCENLRFVFMADSRSDTHGTPPTPEAMINTDVLNAINTQILALSPLPAFVVFGGDMAYRGHYQDSETSFYTFQTFKDVMSSLTNAGIALYTAIGNHELYDTAHDGEFSFANQTEFQAVFSANPGNGPAGYEHLSYSFTSPGGDAFFAVVDPYHLTANVPDFDGGTIDDTQLNWLTAQVAATTATHKFLFIHTPYYYVGTDSVEPSSANVTHTKLWAILDNARFDFYACGHEHLYSRKTIDSTVAPHPQTDPPRLPWTGNVVQLLNGTSGAPPNTDVMPERGVWRVFNGSDTYYFSVVDVSGSQVKVTSYRGNTGAYTVFDSFTINKSAPFAVSVVLTD